MTAEIAILNKTAIALATDSAVTISAGKEEQKIYDSADKLFELSLEHPIGIMIYNGMHFMEIPFPNLINEYRSQRKRFSLLEDAAQDFLEYLCGWEVKCSEETKFNSLKSLLSPVLSHLRTRINGQIEELIGKISDYNNLESEVSKIYDKNIDIFDRVYQKTENSDFIGGGRPRITKARETSIHNIAESYFDNRDKEQWNKIINICKNVVTKRTIFGSQTGVVISGFGEEDIFPTLISYEIDGIIFGRLKYRRTNYVDIHRGAESARVLPFAQKEMVERFLYGLDAGIERRLTQFCKNTIPEIADEILAQLDIEDADRATLKEKARNAEDAFLGSLKETGFDEIRSESRAAIEDMVEFMPKPELATMAEALVNLTSIKRRVSRGMETVGGPIDVAVISRSDGFIWVKRKHYFSADLNPRYTHRVKDQVGLTKGGRYGSSSSSDAGATNKGRRGGNGRQPKKG